MYYVHVSATVRRRATCQIATMISKYTCQKVLSSILLKLIYFIYWCYREKLNLLENNVTVSMLCVCDCVLKYMCTLHIHRVQ